MSKIKILLIDDEQDLLEVMGARIESWGYDLFKAANGKDGIGMLESKRPGIIILDYMMPEMDGLETLKRIRKIDAKIPVIMFTVHADGKTIRGSEKLKVAAFIPKLSLYSDAQSSLKAALSMIEKKLAEQNNPEGKNG